MKIRYEAGSPIPWGGGQIEQPENWRITLTASNSSINAEYWERDTDVHVEQKEANSWQTLANFHKRVKCQMHGYCLPIRWLEHYSSSQ